MSCASVNPTSNACWQAGWYLPARKVVSPNCDARATGSDAIDLVVIHSISLPPGQYGGEEVLELFTNRLDPTAHPYFAGIAGIRVSAHFFIRRDGELIQFVPITKRAWHAGVSNWQGRERCNDFSVGIELEGDDATPFEAAQYQTLCTLLLALKQVLPIKSVTSHAYIAPGRKTDPGPYFNWDQVRVGCPLLVVEP